MPLTGDGTVCGADAVASFVALDSVVCVTLDDYGYWEIEIRLTTKVAGFYGILPNINALVRLLVPFLTGRRDSRMNTPWQVHRERAKERLKAALPLEHEF